MSAGRAENLQKIATAIVKDIPRRALLGLGSGSTVASLLPMVAREMKKRGVSGARWIPTSMQIQLEARKAGLDIAPVEAAVTDMVVDGADQVDEELNLIKGGGGALLKEKVLLSNTKRAIIVADERKFVKMLCSNGVRVPVETAPFAQEVVAGRLRDLKGDPVLRLDQRGFPFFTESGNVMVDTLFASIPEPAELANEVKLIPGVVEVGIFTVRPIEVVCIPEKRGFRILREP